MNLAQMIGRGPYGPRMVPHGTGWWIAGNIAWALLVAGAVALGVLLVTRLTARGDATPTAQPTDAALAQLRMRYARGEIERDDYLRASADLGAPFDS